MLYGEGGIDTEKLLCKTCILEFWDKVTIVDKVPHGFIGNKVIKGMSEVQWDLVDAVIISSLKYQNEMENELLAIGSFNGEIIRLYKDCEVARFFELQNNYDFLTLEKVDSWENALKKSRKGYADENLLQLSYEEFVKCKEWDEKDGKRHYYDVLFYLLKTVVQLQKKEICVLDFGGGFGSLFFHLKYYLKNVNIKFKWIIVEQEQIVERMRENNDTEIVFEKRVKDIDKNRKVDFALLGGSIQYVEDYKNVIQEIIMLKPSRIVLLKTPVSYESFVTVQHTNSRGNHNHYIADYPCRVVSEEALISLFLTEYRLEDSEEDTFNAPNNYLNDHIVKWKTFSFELLS